VFFRHAYFEKRTSPAFLGIILGRRGLSRLYKCVKTLCCLFGFFTKGRIKYNRLAAPWLTIEDSALRYFSIQHFFQAQRLSTELYPIAMAGFGTASFVFDRIYYAERITI
jgi:hypothetical protein